MQHQGNFHLSFLTEFHVPMQLYNSVIVLHMQYRIYTACVILQIYIIAYKGTKLWYTTTRGTQVGLVVDIYLANQYLCPDEMSMICIVGCLYVF